MSRKQIILGFAITQVMSLIGLWASGIFSDGSSLVTMALAILGSIVIASVLWLVVYFFIYVRGQRIKILGTKNRNTRCFYELALDEQKISLLFDHK